MKYGIIFNKSNMNIGDDIQAYATARFLPRIDYYIDREHIDEFQPENNEPVAVIMNAWYMWQKWNWPPSKCIIPLMTGFHYADHQLSNQWYGSPVKFEFLTGIGADYLNAYGPVGCRDNFTLEKLQEAGIEGYFSGCITMTLPNMPETEDRGKYIYIVDVDKRVTEKIKNQLSEEDIEIRVKSHLRERNPDLSWEDRVKTVEDILTNYQNARCVVTRRLHCALPCLAMGVPVLLVRGNEDDTRFSPYYKLLHFSRVKDFLEGNCRYDFLSPPQNSNEYLKYRVQIIENTEKFVKEMENTHKSLDELVKTTYTENDIKLWRHDVMKKALETWFYDSHEKHQVVVEKNKKIKELTEKNKENKENIKKQKDTIKKNREKIKEKNEKIEKLKDENKQLKKQVDYLKTQPLLSIIKGRLKNKVKKK